MDRSHHSKRLAADSNGGTSPTAVANAAAEARNVADDVAIVVAKDATAWYAAAWYAVIDAIAGYAAQIVDSRPAKTDADAAAVVVVAAEALTDAALDATTNVVTIRAIIAYSDAAASTSICQYKHGVEHVTPSFLGPAPAAITNDDECGPKH